MPTITAAETVLVHESLTKSAEFLARTAFSGHAQCYGIPVEIMPSEEGQSLRFAGNPSGGSADCPGSLRRAISGIENDLAGWGMTAPLLLANVRSRSASPSDRSHRAIHFAYIDSANATAAIVDDPRSRGFRVMLDIGIQFMVSPHPVAAFLATDGLVRDFCANPGLDSEIGELATAFFRRMAAEGCEAPVTNSTGSLARIAPSFSAQGVANSLLQDAKQHLAAGRPDELTRRAFRFKEASWKAFRYALSPNGSGVAECPRHISTISMTSIIAYREVQVDRGARGLPHSLVNACCHLLRGAEDCFRSGFMLAPMFFSIQPESIVSGNGKPIDISSWSDSAGHESPSFIRDTLGDFVRNPRRQHAPPDAPSPHPAVIANWPDQSVRYASLSPDAARQVREEVERWNRQRNEIIPLINETAAEGGPEQISPAEAFDGAAELHNLATPSSRRQGGRRGGRRGGRSRAAQGDYRREQESQRAARATSQPEPTPYVPPKRKIVLPKKKPE